VDALARSMNVPYTTFHRRFVAIFEKPPLDWITEEKKKAVYKDIVSSKLSLHEVAKKWNFTSKSYLATWCKQHFGQTPSSMRNTPK
jgi:AraC-like DNA-binding protein